MKKTNEIPVHEKAFNRLYLFNTLSPLKCESLYNAYVVGSPQLIGILKKLTDKEVAFLIDAIEAKL